MNRTSTPFLPSALALAIGLALTCIAAWGVKERIEDEEKGSVREICGVAHVVSLAQRILGVMAHVR